LGIERFENAEILECWHAALKKYRAEDAEKTGQRESKKNFFN